MGLAVLVITIAAVSYFTTGSTAGGLAYVFGQAIGIFLMLSLVYYFLAKSVRIDFRRDVLFLVTAAVLVLTNQARIFGYIDARHFQRDLEAGGAENFEKTLSTSQTVIGSVARDGRDVAIQTNNNIGQLFTQFDDHALDGFLEPAKVKDRSVLLASYQAANAKLAQVRLVMPAVDVLLADEQQKIVVLASRLPEGSRDPFIMGFSKVRAEERNFVERRAANYQRMFEIAASATKLLLDMGEISINDRGQIIFADQNALKNYNELVAGLQQVAQEDEKITSDAAAYDKARLASGWNKMMSN
ncbi:hypothetical protein CIT31_32510 [Mesorhizobium wenxiniae]|uniref:Uncharacterized protein n=2 Tax=Mesorhizobium wenxiniae TaxID=2014805 RepID=A0A271K8U7_9HYPH|nr:hypothetical protein CIT31_32510 [Mesorhizobium wenxiniae]